MSDRNKDTVRRLYEQVLSKYDFRHIDELLSSDFHGEGGPSPIEGPQAFAESIKPYSKAFPDSRVVIEDIIAEGDKVCVRGHYTGTHKGELMGIPATNKPIRVAFTDCWELRDGKIVRGWNLMDGASLLQQLGVFRMPEAAERMAA
jgi:steroid delta-isomerase-like uncharacterized protein